MASALAAAASGTKRSSSSNKATAAKSKALAVRDATINRLRSQMKNAKENGNQIIGAGITVAEIQGSAFLSSMAEGYFTADKMKVAGMDARLGLGGAGVLYGLYQTMQGDNASHVLALSSGVLASGIASAGVKAGQKLAQDKAGKPKMAGGEIAGVREVYVTPAHEGARVAGVRRRR